MLDTPDGIRAAAERLLDAPAGREAIGAFAEELMRLDRIAMQAKEPTEFPEYGPALQAAMDAAETLDDLRRPPGNRLEKLSGDRAGQHSIRINDQWRICFRWREANASEVEIVDYH